MICFIYKAYPRVYGPIAKPIKLLFRGNVQKIGFFDRTEKSEALEKENKYTLVKTTNAKRYLATKDDQ